MEKTKSGLAYYNNSSNEKTTNSSTDSIVDIDNVLLKTLSNSNFQ